MKTTSNPGVAYIKWVIASGLVWPLFVILGQSLGPRTVEYGGAVAFWEFFLVFAGLITGVLQSYATRHTIGLGIRWPVLSALGWMIAVPIALSTGYVIDAINPNLGGGLLIACTFWATGGCIVGIAQWIALRRVIPNSSMWIIVSLLAWAVAGVVSRTLTGQLAGAVYGLISGIWISTKTRGD
jgi:hypothetical protein